jgi:hypothetical protein
MQLTTTNTNDGNAVTNLKNAGFFVNATNKAGTHSLKPISRVAYRKLHKLGNAESKRKYAADLALLRTCITADFAANAATMDFGGIAVTKSGTRKYTLRPAQAVTVTKVRELTADEEMAVAAKVMGVSVEQFKSMKSMLSDKK